MIGISSSKIAWPRAGWKKAWPNRTKPASFKTAQQADWFLLMHDLLTVGFSLQHAVQFSQRAYPKQASFFSGIDRQLQSGRLLADALKPYVKIELYYQLLLAEQHGSLSVTLKEIGQFLQVQAQQRRQLKSLLEYPLILLLMLGMILGALLIFVFPELRSWQQENRLNSSAQWPLGETLIVVGSTFLIYGLLGIRHWRHMTTLKKVRRQCRWPLFGKIFRDYYDYYLTSNLAVLLKHGFSLHEICQLTSRFDDDSLLHQVGQMAYELGSQGKQLTDFILSMPFLPDELAIFINRGLSNEQLGQELTIFSRLRFKKFRQSTMHILVLVQPVLFILIAAGIVSMYLSILLPIYYSLQEVY
ncbi:MULTISPECIES: type II secretion system F family protein [Limosilactobacillus]|uniref:type II secretion system F family protein n=1 Tax=Limosilactobacillus TaxID=2742598 RepID=UPI0024B9FD03|nr:MULTISPECIES: type II secretion system F family protein [Limosilactobacillus]MDD6865661.1 type II secretion system F family protein [Lactobacillus sp.]MDD6894036.1 type II secretion system F family protein [Lactobacillus sp.]MDM8220298.1 type II secretion system F family protein [Limosilactobacillus mucosae]MDM8314862.1 type II secretion system F family protein [Limosilactobacillus mucosae]